MNESHELFVHIRIIIGMILGLSLSRLVTGVTRFIQHPGKEKIDPIHIGWAIFIFLYIVHFWWFEFALSKIELWTFSEYFLLICYVVVFAMLSAVIFPDNVGEHANLREYFWNRRKAFYGLFLVLLAFDVMDTIIKGSDYYYHFYGWYYPARQGLLAIGALVALMAPSKTYHVVFVILALVFQIAWIASLFGAIGAK